MASLLHGYLSAEEASQFTGLAGNTLRVYAKNGKIAHLKVGSRYFFKPEDLTKLITVVKPHNDTSDFLNK